LKPGVATPRRENVLMMSPSKDAEWTMVFKVIAPKSSSEFCDKHHRESATPLATAKPPRRRLASFETCLN
jgi:hypothetical protein